MKTAVEIQIELNAEFEARLEKALARQKAGKYPGESVKYLRARVRHGRDHLKWLKEYEKNGNDISKMLRF